MHTEMDSKLNPKHNTTPWALKVQILPDLQMAGRGSAITASVIPPPLPVYQHAA